MNALRHEFAQDLLHEKVEHISLDKTIAIVTVVGKNIRGSGTVGRAFAALGREHVNSSRLRKVLRSATSRTL